MILFGCVRVLLSRTLVLIVLFSEVIPTFEFRNPFSKGSDQKTEFVLHKIFSVSWYPIWVQIVIFIAFPSMHVYDMFISIFVWLFFLTTDSHLAICILNIHLITSSNAWHRCWLTVRHNLITRDTRGTSRYAQYIRVFVRFILYFRLFYQHALCGCYVIYSRWRVYFRMMRQCMDITLELTSDCTSSTKSLGWGFHTQVSMFVVLGGYLILRPEGP